METGKRKVGIFVPFDKYEQALMQKMLREMNSQRKILGEEKLTLAGLIRGAVRKYCHDHLGKDIYLELKDHIRW